MALLHQRVVVFERLVLEINQNMQFQKILTTASILLILGASCQTTTPENANSSSAEAQRVCPVSTSQPKPLSTTLIPFNQFNFQPASLEVDGDTVTVETPYHTFFACEGTWSIASKPNATDAHDGRDFGETENRDYAPIEVGGQTYEYRIRLEAEWLENLRNSKPAAPQNAGKSDNEDAVYFDFKMPDGKVISRQLYTVGDLRAAGLGNSLSIPRISDTAISSDAPTDIWFSTAAVRGEGASGFANLIHFSSRTGELTVHQPEAIQGAQITSIGIAPNTTPANSNTSEKTPATTLWLGTKTSGEGNPNLPAQGLVAYDPSREQLKSYTTSNSPLVGAIPFQLEIADESLWVATGNGVCQVPWQTAEAADSWDCWRFAATAKLPPEGVDLYPSFLADEPANKLRDDEVEVLWANRPMGNQAESGSAESGSAESGQTDSEQIQTTGLRYEVVYERGFEVQLVGGGFRIVNPVAQAAAQGATLFWPGREWHWNGERFVRSLDEVAINLFGGGPAGLVVSDQIRDGRNVDTNAIRGDFDLLDITGDSTKVRYYSGWVNSSELTVYPTIIPATPAKGNQPNPLDKLLEQLPVQGP